MSVWVRMLGAFGVEGSGGPIAVGGGRPRLVLARLAAAAPSVVRADQLIESVWGEGAPDRAANNLQVHVSNLRKAMRDADPDAVDLIETSRQGYALLVGPAQLDRLHFDETVAGARTAVKAGNDSDGARLFREALAIPQGEPLADLLDNAWAERESLVLAERIAGVWREWAAVELDNGQHLAILPALEERLRDNHLDEGVAGLVVLALYRSGRQTDALRVLADVRRNLADEIGVDPGPELAELENRIFAHDQRLMGNPNSVEAAAAGSTRVRSSKELGFLMVAGRRHFLVNELTTIGRRDDQEVAIDDDDMSREHAVIERTPGGFRIADRGSTNGTWINGDRADAAVLADGDEIWVGSTVLQFRQP